VGEWDFLFDGDGGVTTGHFIDKKEGGGHGKFAITGAA